MKKQKNKKTKICFAASSGGHYEQIMMLMPLAKKYDAFILTEKTRYNSEKKEINSYFVHQINRTEWLFLIKLFFNFICSLVIFAKEKPDVIICTGALATVPICLIAKIFRKKLIFIESFAKVTSPTETGKIIYKYADLFFIQWESLREYYPNALFLGGIY